MAITTFADVFEPDVFTQNLTERIMTKSKFWRAGVFVNDPKLDSLATAGGREVTVPFFKPIALGEAQTLSDSSDITVSNITMGNQVASVVARAQAWGSSDLAQAFNNKRADPLDAIQGMVADYWANEQQSALLSIFAGVFGGPLATTHSFDYELSAGDVVNGTSGLTLDPTAAIAGQSLLGDNLNAWENGVIVMHPDVYYNLKKLNYIDRIPVDSAGTVALQDQYNFTNNLDVIEVEMFAGMQVIVDAANGLTKAAGTTSGFVYDTYMVKRGAIGYGNGLAPVPVEMERDALKNGGQDVLVNRMHYLIHPYGTSFAAAGGGALAGTTPTNTELATTAKWSKVFTDDRNIEMVRVRTNG